MSASKRRFKLYSLYLPPETVERLRELSRQSRLTATLIVRDILTLDAIDQWARDRGLLKPTHAFFAESAADEQTFHCAGCERDVPWSQGAADDGAALCDDCWAVQRGEP